MFPLFDLVVLLRKIIQAYLQVVRYRQFQLLASEYLEMILEWAKIKNLIFWGGDYIYPEIPFFFSIKKNLLIGIHTYLYQIIKFLN